MKTYLLAFLLVFWANACHAQAKPLPLYVSLNYSLNQPTTGYSVLADSTSTNPYEAIAIKKGEVLLMVNFPASGWAEAVKNGRHYFVRTSVLSLADKVPPGVYEFNSPPKSTYQGNSYQGSEGRPIQTGPRGGRYYINSNGNKTYIKH